MPEETTIAPETLQLEPSNLWTRAIEQTEYAYRCGALQSIPTEYEFVFAWGIRFLVRIISNLARKDAAAKPPHKQSATSNSEFNPFLPYEEDLFVADISDTHLCLLNKFNVVEHHLLIVTRAFEEQEDLLNLQDFEAMWIALAAIDGLVFYNSGKAAGASQRHKHLQLVPLPLIPDGERIPIEPLLATTSFQGAVGRIPSLPFVHALAKLDLDGANSPQKAAAVTLQCYRTLLQAVGLLDDKQSISNQAAGAYNLLATRQWMLIVPRSQESFESISVNSLGFAGALLVRNQEQMKILKNCGPLSILTQVAQPW
ncbi:MAG: phosphorylase [Aphanothece sp. CMT-3BRIN-NPC111]|nr:phosphorylase [Aphanothece sp. CMT-3BRIN-NPC111]